MILPDFTNQTTIAGIADFLLTQKNFAVYKKYTKDDSFLSNLIDTQQVLFGLLGDSEEVLAGYPIIAPIEPMDANVRHSSRLTEQPLENGTVVADHAIIEPVRISVWYSFPGNFYKDFFQEALNLFREKTELVVVTKIRPYWNMVVTEIGYPMEVRNLNRMRVEVVFREAIRVWGRNATSLADIISADDAPTSFVGSINSY